MPDFEPKFSVIRVREKYSAPYKKYMYFYINRKDLKSEKTFSEKINSVVKNWKDGDYYLKYSTGKVFARFEVKDGKLKKLYRTSPSTQREYPCWEFFKK